MMAVEDAPNLNALWARLMLAELSRLGARHVVVCPGSRSTPLALAAHACGMECTVALDERGAAFHALGIAKATGAAAPVITTSGTAVANLVPAAVEAWASGVPMVLLTADRPPELLECGANQAIPQRDLLGRFARWSVDLGCPTEVVDARVVLSTIGEAWNRAHTAPGGAVHVNMPFREPLGMEEHAWNRGLLAPLAPWLRSTAPWRMEVSTGGGPGALSALRAATRGSARGIIVAGALRGEEERRTALLLAGRLGWPVLADVASGLRCVPSGGAQVVAHGDLIVRSARAAACLTPDSIIRIGGAITSKPIQQWMDGTGVRPILLGRHAQRQDPSHTAALAIDADLGALFTDLAQAGAEGLPPSPSSCAGGWMTADLAATAAVASWMESSDGLDEPWIAWWLAGNAPDGALFAGNSMPVRDLEMHAPVRCGPVTIAQRGASGIDGLIATATGIARSGTPTTAVIGDVSALHDLSSLDLLRRATNRCTLVIVNNDGGGIFHFLPVAGQAVPFEALFGTPHGRGFEHAAAMFSLPFERASTRAEATTALQRAWACDGPAVVELVTDRANLVAQHRAIQASVCEAVEAAIA